MFTTHITIWTLGSNISLSSAKLESEREGGREREKFSLLKVTDFRKGRTRKVHTSSLDLSLLDSD